MIDSKSFLIKENTNFKKNIFIIFILCNINIFAQITQIGQEITGTSSDERFGSHISLNGNGDILAIGNNSNDPFGKVQVYQLITNNWVQLGADLEPNSKELNVKLNTLGDVLAVGNPESGKVTLYQYASPNWSISHTFIGNAGSSYGSALAISKDAKFAIIGNKLSNQGSHIDAGHVEVWEDISGVWTQRGSSILGTNDSENLGSDVSISDNGNTILIGSPNNKGKVQAYQWDGTTWVNKGNPILGELNNEGIGNAIDISTNGNQIAIGSPKQNGNKGRVKIYIFDGTDWVQKGQNIDGSSSTTLGGALNNFGASLEMTPSGDSIIVGGPSLNFSYFAGYKFNICKNIWEEFTRKEEGFLDFQGGLSTGIAISSDGLTIAAGAPILNNEEGTVKVYSLPPPSNQDIQIEGNNTNINNNNTLINFDDNTNFDTNYINIDSTLRVFNIINTGDKDLLLTQVSIEGVDKADFTFDNVSVPYYLCKSDTLKVEVKFKPRSLINDINNTPARILRDAFFNILSNDPDEGDFKFNIQGTALGEASVKLSNTLDDIHGFQSGDILATYSNSIGGNIRNSTAEAIGSGVNQGLQNQENFTVTPYGTINNQAWYLFYDNNVNNNYPTFSAENNPNLGANMIVGFGHTPISGKSGMLDNNHTEYLFYIDHSFVNQTSTTEITNISDTLFIKQKDKKLLDIDLNISDSYAESLFFGNGNFNTSSLTIRRKSGANIDDQWSIAQSSTISIRNDTIFYNTTPLATFSNSNGVININFQTSQGVNTTSIINEIVNAIEYQNDNINSSITFNVSFDYRNQNTRKEKIVSPSPEFTSFSPKVAKLGDTITMVGNNMQLYQSTLFNTVAATEEILVNSSSLKAIVGNGESGFVILSNENQKDSLEGFIFDGATEEPNLVSPPTGKNISSDNISISYVLPEKPLAGSVKLTFNDGTSTTEWNMVDVLNVTFKYTIDESPSSTFVSSGASIPAGTYSISISYQDSIGNSREEDIHSNITISGNPCAESFSTITIEECKEYTSPSGKTFSNSGTVKDTILNYINCDSIITIDLTILEGSIQTIDTITCRTYISPKGISYNSSASFSDTLSNINGCDSILNINLTVLPITVTRIDTSSCHSIQLPDLSTVSETGEYQTNITSSIGCDSIVIVKYTNLSDHITIDTTSLNSYISPKGVMLTESGVYHDTLTNRFNCDSIITINLTINKVVTIVIDTISCNEYISPKGNVITNSTIFRETIKDPNGTDSIFDIALTIVLSDTTKLDASSCESYELPDLSSVSQTGSYTTTLTNRHGCDSVIITNYVRLSNQRSIDTTSINTYTSPKGTILTESGTYNDTLTNQFSCDSIIIINLTIKKIVNINLDTTSCNEYFSPSGEQYLSSSSFNDTLENVNGTDTIFNINLTILEQDTTRISVTSCDSVQLPDLSYVHESGVYKTTLNRLDNCDSIVVTTFTNLTTRSSINVTTKEDYISPQGKTFNESGIFLDTIKNQNNCDSIITINLTVLEPIIQNIDTSSCNEYISPVGDIYETSSAFSDTLSATNGADSILNINLTILEEDIFEFSVSSCDSFRLPDNSYALVTGEYKTSFTKSNGCDSIIIINYINTSNLINIDTAVISSYLSPNGNIYSQSGVYYDTLTNRLNCDSIILTNLEILGIDSDDDGIIDEEDNCPNIFNPDQLDTYGNSDGDACSDQLIVISETLTPNGDNINDTWKLGNIENVGKIEIEIYNRWGKKVYETDDYKNDWGGQFNGNESPLPSGSYFFILKTEIEQQQGWLYLSY